MNITVKTKINAPIDMVWSMYTTPVHIKQWNAASDDWHTTASHVDLRVGGAFSSRMEAKDGSFGFDFAGTYSNVVPHKLIAYTFGERTATVEFIQDSDGVTVSVSFTPETEHTIEEQEEGWQAILNRFAMHVQSTKPA